MIKRGRGRPAKVDPNRKRITVDQAVKITEKFWSQFDRPGYSKNTIYNLSAQGKLEKETHGRCILLFEDDVIRKLCG